MARESRTIENALLGQKGAIISLLKSRFQWSADAIRGYAVGDALLVEDANRAIATLKPKVFQTRSVDKLEPFVVGEHDEATIEQLRRCLDHDDAVAGALCADGHFGYSQPVGGVVAYREHISISGVGYDIGCGNMAVRTDCTYGDIKRDISIIMDDIAAEISFGIGGSGSNVGHPMFDKANPAWEESGAGDDLRVKAIRQFGSVGGGNHYVDLFVERCDDLTPDECPIWIGVHFGSRGLGHTLATRYLKLAGGKAGPNDYPTLVHQNTALGEAYIAAMKLSGEYAHVGRELVVQKVLDIVGAWANHIVHNHHNYAWREMVNGSWAWVVRKGCTPIGAGLDGFVGGSMGDDAVILGVAPGAALAARNLLNSTVHGAGRVMSRTKAKATFSPEEMYGWLRDKGVELRGGDLDESPMAYRRLNEVLAHHADTILVKHTLRPIGVAMAPSNIIDPYKD